MRRPLSQAREGMILLNVLVIVAIAAAAVAVMIAAQDIEVQRTIRLRDASQAQAYSRAGELSAVVALRRDGVSAPTLDAYSEPWAAIAQRPIAIPHGRFALAIVDEQARFNLNSLTSGDAVEASRFARIARELGVSQPGIVAIAGLIAAVGPLQDESLLSTAGVDPADLERLRPFVAFLPEDARLNLNTASPELLRLLLDDADAVRRLMDLRNSKRALTEADLATLGLQNLGGLTSSHFAVVTDVRVGDVEQRVQSRLTRIITPEQVEVSVSSRRRIDAGSGV